MPLEALAKAAPAASLRENRHVLARLSKNLPKIRHMEQRNHTEPLFFRAMEPEDLTLLFQMENRQESRISGESRIPYSYDLLKRYIENSQQETFLSSGQLRLLACQSSLGKQDGSPAFPSACPQAEAFDIGIVDFFNYDAFCQRAEIGILVLPRFRNQGYGEKILRSAADYAKNQLNLHQLYAEILAGNTASIRIFESCGFRNCGCKKDWFRAGGQWRDVLSYQLVWD